MSEIAQEAMGAVAFGAIACIILWIARRKGFFSFPHSDPWKVPLGILPVLAVFAIYFGVVLFITPLLVSFAREFLHTPPSQEGRIALASWMQFVTSFLIAFLLAVFWRTREPSIRQEVWRHKISCGSYGQDIVIAALAWGLSFPLVFSVSQFLDLFVFTFFQITSLPDQAAVSFLKTTFQYPLYFAMAIISIIGFAPFIEELIFRGFLQTYARRFMTPTHAILVSSLCFSFFHFTPEQGLSNIPIIGSLFVLALFLGFVYERQKSLFASMALHAIFNTVSIFNLYSLGGAPRGAL